MLWTVFTACSSAPEGEPVDLDASLYALTGGVDGASFLPPLGPDLAHAGTFDAAQLASLRVVLEARDAAGGVHPLASFDRSTSPRLALLAEHELYFVNVPAATYITDPSMTYRFRVLLTDGAGARELAFSDLSDHIFTVMRYVPTVPIGVKIRLERRPAPALSAVSPDRTPSGATTTLTLTGAGFVHDSVARLGGAPLATTWVSATTLTAVASSSLMQAGHLTVDVSTPSPGGGTSQAVGLVVYDAAPVQVEITDGDVGAYAGRDVTVPPSSTVTLSTSSPVDFQRLEVGAGSKIIQTPCTASACYCHHIRVAGDFVLHAGASIDGAGKGYPGSHQQGNSYYGLTAGGVYAGASWWSGGSHGGYGGIYAGAPTAIYDDPYEPSLAGAGGNSYPGYVGASGGACLRITVGGTFQLDGTISVDGGSAAYTGGAGGTVWITADVLSSSRTELTISANGGDASHGAGGGGRIALHYNTLRGFSIDGATVQANGGHGSSASYNGGPGTVVYGRSASRLGSLLVSAPADLYSRYATTRLGAFGWITGLSPTVLTTSDPLVANTLVGKTLRPSLEGTRTFRIASNTESTITVEAGDLTSVASVGGRFFVVDHQSRFDDVTIADGASFAAGALVADHVNVKDSAVLRADWISAGSYASRHGSTALVRTLSAGDVMVAEAATLRGFDPTTTRVFPLEIDARRLTVGPTAHLSVDGLGYLGSHQNGNSYYGLAVDMQYPGSSWWSGGSHGGWGGIYSGRPGDLFDDVYEPRLAGGGGNSYPGYVGSNGGGVLRLDVSEDLQLDGLVSANGMSGTYTGGAGGAIWISTAGRIGHDGAGPFLQANGGAASHGAGGGGRIALYYGALDGWTVSADTVRTYGGLGSSATYNGGSGTIYSRPSSDPAGTLLLSTTPERHSAAMPGRVGAFGMVTGLSDTELTTSDPLIPGTLAGKSLVPDSEAPTVTLPILSNTGSTITVAGGLAARTAPGRTFYVADYATRFANVVLEDEAYETGLLAVGAQVLVRGATALRSNTLRASSLRVVDGARVHARRVETNSVSLEGTSALRPWPTTTAAFYPLHVTATNVTIGPSAAIDADALGYLGSYQGGNSYYGLSVGLAYDGASWWSGGSHGGWGGVYSGRPSFYYDDLYAPTLPGAGGNSYPGYVGSSGGGVLDLTVAGTLHVEGVVTANGGSGTYTGGAGGSILVHAGRIATTAPKVLFRVNGGASSHGAGAGGRVALYYGALDGFAIDPLTVQAFGGAGSSVAYNGSSGTIYSRAPGQALGDLLLSAAPGGNSSWGPSGFGAFGTITGLSGSTLTTSDPLPRVDLAGHTLKADYDSETRFTIVSSTTDSITVSGDLSGVAHVGGRFQVTDFETAFDDVTIDDAVHFRLGELDVGRIALSGSSILAINDLRASTVTAVGSSQLIARHVEGASVSLTGAAVLSGYDSTTAEVYPLEIQAGALFVGDGARITQDSRGYLGSYQNGNGYYGMTDGNMYRGAAWWSGGSHGGRGGEYSPPAAETYGNALTPTTPGGGGNSYPGYTGGSGGGVIRISSTGAVTINGLVSANGGGASYTGGAGGSVWITAATLATTSSAPIIQANGGSSSHGAGGGGRIALYGSRVGFGAQSVQADGGGASSSAYNGWVGSIHFGN